MPSEVAEFYDRYERSGLRFPQSVLTRYALSLSTKPFVILSGISGTGKTKIAQLFSVPRASMPIPKAGPISPARARMVLPLTAGVLTGDGRGNLANRYMSVLFEPSELAQIEANGANIVAQGRMDNVIDPITIVVETPNGEELQFGMYVQRPASPLVRVRAKSKYGEPNYYNSQDYLAAKYKVGDNLELEKIAPHRFRIVPPATEIQESEIKQAADELQAELDDTVENRLFISVQSDWLDRMPLFGAPNQITGLYGVTPFLSFVIEASKHPNVPFFVILDEMNLSKVEHYFSDYLSCLESAIMDRGTLHREPVLLHGSSRPMPADNDDVEEVPPQLLLPPNLYITGSVNVDETTYMFSPKVLDRSNVIEFNDVDLDLLDGSAAPAGGGLALSQMPSFGTWQPASVADYQALPQHAKELLKDLISILQPYSLHFGYRVANEIGAFIGNALACCAGPETEIVQAALDAQLAQKVLPKFNGSQAALEEPLRAMLLRLLKGSPVAASIDASALTAEWLAQNSAALASSFFPLATVKLARMLRDLQIRGFASFAS